MDWDGPAVELSPEHTRLLRILAGLGAVTIALGLWLAPTRAWANLLLVSYYLVGLALAGMVFIALQYVSGAGWSAALRRVPEAMGTVLPYGAAGVGLVLLLRSSLYPWVHQLHDPTGFRKAWLNFPFFIERSAIYIALWLLFTWLIVRTSRRQDHDGDLAHTQRNISLSAAFLVVFAITFWLASFDWIMSLEPRWYSTIFGIYNFAGLFSSGLAAIIVLAICLHRMGPLDGVLSSAHLHDLGKLLFAFTTFWMYIWFSQYMLIWYANIPEEAVYYVRRMQGAWMPLFILNMVLNWAIPFLALLSASAKKNPGILLKVSVMVLLGRWLDLYLMILPPVSGARPEIAAWEIGAAMGMIGVFGLLFFRVMRRANIVPVNDPYLAESLAIHE
jgi:hypothetical protein